MKVAAQREESGSQKYRGKAALVVRGSFFRLVNFFAQAIAGLFLTPFIIHHLGDRVFGFWVLVGTLLGYYGLLDLGFSSAIKRFLSKEIGAGRKEEIKSIISTAFFVYAFIGLCAVAITVGVILFVPYFTSVPSEARLFQIVIFVLGIDIAIQFPMRTFEGVLISYMRFDVSTGIALLKLVLRVAGTYFLLESGYGIFSLALLSLFINLQGHIITLLSSLKIEKASMVSLNSAKRSLIRQLFGYSIFTFLAQIADQLRFRIDNFVIAGFLSLSLVTHFSIASRITDYFINFMIAAVGVMMPVFSQYEGQGDYDSIREKFILSTRISNYLAILVGGSLLIYGKVFIMRWVGAAYVDAYPILIILTISTTVALMQVPSVNVLYAISRHKFYTISNSGEGISNLVLSLILVKSYGLVGVALGTAIPMFIVKFFIQPVFVCHCIKLSVRRYYFSIFLPSFLKAGIPMMIYYFLIADMLKPTYLRILYQGAAHFLIIGVLMYFLGFNKSERRYFTALFRPKSAT